MIEFWFAAAGLLLAALSFLLVPLWRQRQQSDQWSIVGLAATVALVPVTLGVYLSVSTGDGGGQAGPAESAGANANLPAIADMVESLAARLRENPDDVTGWLMLGRSYSATGRYPEAVEAFREAWARTSVPGAELKVALAEAEALIDPEALTGAAGRLFDEVLAEDPSNEKALWYGGLAALQRGEPDLVRQRWTALLAIGVPEQMAEVMQEQLAALPPASGASAQPAAQSGATPAAQSGAAPAAQSGAAPAAQSGATPAAQSGATPAAAPLPAADEFAIQLNVTLGGDVANVTLAPQSALFVFARAPEGGPPLAVIRESAASIPGEFSLSDANAMVPGRSLADFESLLLVARVSNSGQPTEQSGDLFGELEFRPGDGGTVADLIIDQAVP